MRLIEEISRDERLEISFTSSDVKAGATSGSLSPSELNDLSNGLWSIYLAIGIG